MIHKERRGFSIKVSLTVSDMTIRDAVKEISESNFGLHCLLIYPNLKTFREFYIYYLQKQFREKNELILFNPFYETVSTVRQNLAIGHIQVNEFHDESDISLIISDSLNQYFGRMSISEFKERLVKYAQDKRKDGVSILSDMGPYFLKNCTKN